MPASGRAPLDVVLTAEGSDPDGDALTYAWDFGDGSATREGPARAAHLHARAGRSRREVTVDRRGGRDGVRRRCRSSSATRPANQAPTVVAAADPVGRDRAAEGQPHARPGSDPDGDALSYAWSFGDGGQAGGPKVTHTFAAAGSYTVTVTVRDAGGGTGTATLTGRRGGAAAARRRARRRRRRRSGGGDRVGRRATVARVRPPRAEGGGARAGRRGRARASVWVSRAAAQRLGLRSRRLGSRGARRARAGATVTVRVQAVAGGAQARWLARRAALRVSAPAHAGRRGGGGAHGPAPAAGR